MRNENEDENETEIEMVRDLSFDSQLLLEARSKAKTLEVRRINKLKAATAAAKGKKKMS